MDPDGNTGSEYEIEKYFLEYVLVEKYRIRVKEFSHLNKNKILRLRFTAR